MARCSRWSLLLLLLASAALLSGCPKRRAMVALSTAELVRVEVVDFGGDALVGRVQVRWPDQRGPICLERVDWSVRGEPSLFLRAEPEGPCVEPERSGDPVQWLRVETTPAALAALAEGDSPPGSRSLLVARVGAVALELEGRARPGVRLADGCIIELGGAVVPGEAELEIRGFRAWVHLTLTNVLSADVQTGAGRWTFLRGGRRWTGGTLEVPSTLPAGHDFQLSVELGTDQALALATASVIGSGEFRFELELELRTPWGRAIVVSSFGL